MKITIVVDANIILSALLGGKPSTILFDSKFSFATTSFTMGEVHRYLPRVEKKTGAPRKELTSLLKKLPLTVYKRAFYEEKLGRAEKMIADIDKKDVQILALAFKLSTYLWSQDKDFEKAGYQKLLKTHHFLI